MNPIKYLKKKGFKRAIKVIWQYKIDILFQMLLKILCKNRSLLNCIVIESHNDFDSNGGAFYDYLIDKNLNEQYRIIVLMWLMIIISLTSETILVNDGFQIAFIMSIITKTLSIKYSSNVKAID